MSFLHYFHSAISNHLSEKPNYVLFYMVAKHRFDCSETEIFIALIVFSFLLITSLEDALTTIKDNNIRNGIQYAY